MINMLVYGILLRPVTRQISVNLNISSEYYCGVPQGLSLEPLAFFLYEATIRAICCEIGG